MVPGSLELLNIELKPTGTYFTDLNSWMDRINTILKSDKITLAKGIRLVLSDNHEKKYTKALAVANLLPLTRKFKMEAIPVWRAFYKVKFLMFSGRFITET